MPQPDDAPAAANIATMRVTLTLIGGFAGLSAWLLVDVLPDVITNGHALLFLAAALGGVFVLLLALTGPVPLRRTLPVALGVGLSAGALLWLSALSFDEIGSFMTAFHGFAAFALLLVLVTPFAAAGLRGGAGWRDYPQLFDLSWTIMVQMFAALLFAGMAWALLFLSGAVLEIVGIEVIERLTREGWFSLIFSGAIFGLSLAVVQELRDYLSPRLVLRLLRLLVPAVLVVVAVFLLALPFRGISGLVGELSAAATLLAISLFSILLIAVSVERNAQGEITARWMRVSVMGLACALPLLAGLSVYAIGLRVAQYGLTPPRVIAGSVALVVGAYALCYAVALLRRNGWTVQIRKANIELAIMVMALCVLWLTPVISPERMAVRNQVARAEAGVPVVGLPLYEMAHDWGRPGRAGIERLRASGGAALLARIAAAEAADNRWAFARDEGNFATYQDRAAFAAKVTVLPGNTPLDPDVLHGVEPITLSLWSRECDGPEGCLLIDGPFAAQGEDRQSLLVSVEQGRMETLVWSQSGTGSVHALGNDRLRWLSSETVDALRRGDYTFGPSKRTVLHVDGIEIFPDN